MDDGDVSTEKGNPHAPCVLVVDDEPFLANVIVCGLELYGFEAVYAANAASAMRMAADKNPDAVLLDLSLPDMDGVRVCAEMRKLPALHSIPIIIFSGWLASSFEEEAAIAGATACITKPFTPQYLADLLHQYIGRTAAVAG